MGPDLDEVRTNSLHANYRPGGDKTAEDWANLLDFESRCSSIGFEGYYDQYLGYGEEKKGHSRSGSKLSVLGGGGSYNRWTHMRAGIAYSETRRRRADDPKR